jgi:hypothetical protein
VATGESPVESPVENPVEEAAAALGKGAAAGGVASAEAGAEASAGKGPEEEEGVAVARPVSGDPVQVLGWKEWVVLSDGTHSLKIAAKLDTGADTSSIHALEKKLFERDGKKWVRFVVCDPQKPEAGRIRIEAPLVRIAHVKKPGGSSQAREVVRLPLELAGRRLKADFTLSDRSNMRMPVLLGRALLCELGWVDSSRAFLAEEKIMR